MYTISSKIGLGGAYFEDQEINALKSVANTSHVLKKKNRAEESDPEGINIIKNGPGYRL